MNISNIFSTEERIEILRGIIFKKGLVSVNRVASDLKLSKGFVSKYFSILIKEKILKMHKNKFAVLDNSFVKSAKIFLNVSQFDVKLFRKYKFIKAVGMYGSCAKGTNDEDSDIDLWIKVDEMHDRALAKISNELLSKYHKTKVLFLDEDKIRSLKKQDPEFYYSLYFGSINLYGKEGEI